MGASGPSPAGPAVPAGPTATVERWWREHADRVRAYLHHRTDPATADDVLQEVFVVALRRWSEVPEPPVGWLFGTARRVLANHHRAGRRYRGLLGRLADAHVVAAPPPADDDELAARVALDLLLDGLSDRDREVLTLSAWYGLTPTEAAAALGITANAYTVRLHRARSRLNRTGDRTRDHTGDHTRVTTTPAAASDREVAS